jgi:hypothetical protein
VNLIVPEDSMATVAPETLAPAHGAAGGWRTWHLVGLAGLSAYSTAIGWQAQLVSYPLYRAVGDDDFAAYHLQYDRSIPLVVILPGFATFLASAALPWTRPSAVSPAVARVVAATGLASLASTVLWAIPQHDRLDRDGRSEEAVDSLLRANLVRSTALTVGTLALGWCVGRLVAAGRGPSRP